MSETAEQKTMNFGYKQMCIIVMAYLDTLRNVIIFIISTKEFSKCVIALTVYSTDFLMSLLPYCSL